MADFRAVITIDITSEDKETAAQLARAIARSVKNKKHATIPTTRTYGSDVIEIRSR